MRKFKDITRERERKKLERCLKAHWRRHETAMSLGINSKILRRLHQKEFVDTCFGRNSIMRQGNFRLCSCLTSHKTFLSYMLNGEKNFRSPFFYLSFSSTRYLSLSGFVIRSTDTVTPSVQTPAFAMKPALLRLLLFLMMLVWRGAQIASCQFEFILRAKLEW